MLPLRSDAKRVPLAGVRALIIEDSLERGSSLCRSLRAFGIEVLWIERATEVEQSLEQWKPQLILLDLSLPDVDGVLLCHVLCDRGLPVVALADQDDPDQHVAVLDAGVADVVTRGCPDRLLIRRLANVWAHVRQDAQQMSQIEQLTAYVPRVAVRQARGAPERLSATLLFSDLRGFTRVSCSSDAAEVFDTINQILALQISSVQAAGGYVDGFSGDGMLALFEGPRGPLQACQAAASILALAEKTAIGPWEQLPVALGIHQGEVMRGDLGAQRRRVFTVLGSPVNLAARLCGVAGAREAVVSQSIAEAVDGSGRFRFTDPRAVQLKGIDAPFSVYTLG